MGMEKTEMRTKEKNMLTDEQILNTRIKTSHLCSDHEFPHHITFKDVADRLDHFPLSIKPAEFLAALRSLLEEKPNDQ